MDKMGSFRAGGGCPSPGSVGGHRMDEALGSLEWCRGSWRSLPTHPLIPPGQEGMGPGGPCLLMGGGGGLASRIPNLPGSPVALSPFGDSKGTLAAQRCQRHPPLCSCQRCRRELPLLSEGFPGPHSSWIHPSALQRLTQPWGECESNGCGVGRSPPRAGDAPSRRSTGARR